MKSPVVKRSIVLNGHKTSVSLEEAFWSSVKEISGKRGMTLSELVSEIVANRQGNMSSAIRLFVLDHFKLRAEAPNPHCSEGIQVVRSPAEHESGSPKQLSA